MRDAVERVLRLQSEWASQNTPAMQERGLLIRKTIPEFLEASGSTIRIALGVSEVDFGIEGSDGKGLKTEVPWVRFFSRNHSPNAREGWYCVYLFHARGEGVYLSIDHGSTRLEGGEFKPKSDAELATVTRWARTELARELREDERLRKSIDLGASVSKLARSYEQGNAVAIWYARDALPRAEDWVEDARYMATLVGRLYEAEDRSVAPYSMPPEIVMAEDAIADLSRPLSAKRRGGQGRGLSRAEIVAVELRAMSIAKTHFEQRGYDVNDVSASESYDLRASNGSTDPIMIEVKGTTGGPMQILLTAAEVRLHKNHYPNNALAVVHGIRLSREADSPSASGGEMMLIWPWRVDETRLTPTAFRYTVVTESDSGDTANPVPTESIADT